MNMKRIVILIVLAMTVLPLMAQNGGTAKAPNYRRINKEINKVGGPYFLDSLQARFDRCDTTLTIDHIRCLYFGVEKPLDMIMINHRYDLLVGRFGRHQGKANDTWWQLQMLLSAVWSTGDGSRRHPLHVHGLNDAAFIMASDFEGYYKEGRAVNRRRYVLMRYIAMDGQASGDVWFYIRKQPSDY